VCLKQYNKFLYAAVAVGLTYPIRPIKNTHTHSRQSLWGENSQKLSVVREIVMYSNDRLHCDGVMARTLPRNYENTIFVI
jgi:hypothetical protein